MDGSMSVATMNAFFIICERSMVIEVRDKIGFVGVAVDSWIIVFVWQWCLYLSRCDMVLTMVQRNMISFALKVDDLSRALFPTPSSSSASISISSSQ